MSTHAICLQDDDLLDRNSPKVAATAATGERRWERVRIDCRVRVSYNVGRDIETVDGQGNDISEGGISIYVPAELSAGDHVTIELVRRYGKPRVTVAARVNNGNGFRYGLEFVGLEDAQRSQIVANFIEG